MTGISSVSFQITSGTAISASIDLQGYGVVAIIMPASWDAADLTFQGSHDNITFYNVYDGLGGTGNELVERAAASRYIITDPDDFKGMHYIKVRSGTGTSPVNQTATRTLSLVLRG